MTQALAEAAKKQKEQSVDEEVLITNLHHNIPPNLLEDDDGPTDFENMGFLAKQEYKMKQRQQKVEELQKEQMEKVMEKQREKEER